MIYSWDMSTISRSVFTVAALAGVWVPFRSVFAGSGSTMELLAMTRLYSMRMQTVLNKIVLKNRYNTLEIEENGRRAWINGVMFWLHEPCRRSGRAWAIRWRRWRNTLALLRILIFFAQILMCIS